MISISNEKSKSYDYSKILNILLFSEVLILCFSDTEIFVPPKKLLQDFV